MPCGTRTAPPRRPLRAVTRLRRRGARGPSAKSAIRQPGTGWPRRASVRARIAYAPAMSAIGASWSGSSVQLVEQGQAHHAVTVTPHARRLGAVGPATRRTLRRASRSRTPTRSSSGCALQSSPPERLASAPSPASIRWTRPVARRVDRLGRHEARSSPASAGALRACGADLAAHCINDVATCGAEPLLFLDYVAANRIELETGGRARRGRGRGLPRGGRRARRRRDRRAARDLPGRRARLRRARASASSNGPR